MNACPILACPILAAILADRSFRRFAASEIRRGPLQWASPRDHRRHLFLSVSTMTTSTMTSALDSRCPKCGLPLRMQQPAVASEIVCPKCRHRFGLMPDGKLISVASLDAFSNLPDPVIATIVPSKPKGVKIQNAPPATPEPPPVFGETSTSTPIFQSRMQPRTALSGMPTWLRKSIAPALCIAITIGVLAAVVVNRDRLPVDRFASKERLDSFVANLPLSDSHEKVMDEFTATIQAAETALQTLSQSDDSSDRKVTAETIESLKTLQRKIDQLTRRTVAMEPLPPDRFADSSDPIVQKMTAAGEATKSLLQAIDGINVRAINRLDRAGELDESANDLAKQIYNFPSTRKLAWNPLDRPRNPLQEIEYETLLIQRGLWRSMALVQDESDYRALGRKLNLAAEEILDVAAKYEKIEDADALFRIYSRYLDAALMLNSGISESMAVLKSRYGDLDDADADAMNRYLDAIETLKAKQRPHSAASATEPGLTLTRSRRYGERWDPFPVPVLRSATQVPRCTTPVQVPPLPLFPVTKS